MAIKVILITLLLVCVSGCSFNSGESPSENVSVEAKKTLGSVYFEPMPLNHDPIPTLDLASLRDAYKGLQQLLHDSETQQIVQYRLADLEILLAEQHQESGIAPSQQGLYDLAIRQYQQILNDHPAQKQNAEVLYQLAKAHDLQGQSAQSFEVIERLLVQYPDNPYLAEVYFRKGEILFAQGDYFTAIDAYENVLNQGEENAYFVTAAYMLGWSYFKTEQQQNALLAFTRLLDNRLPNNVVNQKMLTQIDSQALLDGMPVGERRLVNDTLRIMALLFSYQASEQSLVAHFKQIGERHYEHLLYEQLGQQYLNDDRYRDSALVYQAFTEQHPEHNLAPFFAVKQIDAYILGEFPSLVLPAKQSFVARYGINGPQWQNWGLLLQEGVKPFLHQYLQELAQFEHSKAQLLAGVNTEASQVQKAREAYGSAAGYYREFIMTFPHDERTPIITFNLAESLSESGNFKEAIDSYEVYAYQYLDEPKGAEAAYAAILGYKQVLLSMSDPQQNLLWRDRQLVSQGRFVNRFAHDSRAAEVLYDSQQQLFELQRYPAAIAAAEQLLDWRPEVNATKRLSSQLVVAHSQFELSQFALAEFGYDKVLTLLPEKDQRRLDMTERLAASIYKQAEQKRDQNQLALAVEDFLRVIEKAPYSAIRTNAQFDAANYLLELEDWPRSAALFEDFRTRFAGHSLVSSIGDKLIYNYQQNGKWLLAANELLSVWQKKPKSEEGRQALYVAAQYFQQEGKTQQALESFRSYAHGYPQPFEEATEARFNMSEFYRLSKEDSKRRFWLSKLIKADADAGANRTDRSRYLAAMSSLVFANDKLVQFKRIKLSLPLKKSITKKKSALESAMLAFNKTLDYQVAEFSTDASYKVAEIYHQLAKDLMASERPKGLSALELEQYDILLEEQSYPFEEQAIEGHEINAQRSWQGAYDSWVKQSFSALAKLLPGRYNKQEKTLEISNEIH